MAGAPPPRAPPRSCKTWQDPNRRLVLGCLFRVSDRCGMAYRQDISHCFGDGLLARAEYDRLLAQTQPRLAQLAAARRDGSLPLLQLPDARDDLAACEQLAAHLMRDTSALVFLGTGGSSLGAQALAQSVDLYRPIAPAAQGKPRFHFLDNLDPWAMDSVLSDLDLRSTRFLIVSKSGGTAETLMQALTAIGRIEAAGGGKYIKHHFGVITEPGDRPLRRLAAQYDIPVVDHPPRVGGRYAVLTAVGMVPAICLGLDPVAIRTGAAAVLDPLDPEAGAVEPAAIPAAEGAALSVAAARTLAQPMQVFMPYGDRLERFAMWHRQLWAESLGKQGKGTTPVTALGPVDQHSQLQLYLGGPRDKLYTIFTQSLAGAGPRAVTDDPDLAWLSGRTIGDLADAEQRATIDTLIANGRPLRTIAIDRPDAPTIGALMMHFMLETILAADLLGVDPFDQPAVEEGKQRARAYLAELGG
ncbi:MAG TPA: glucose-6-phosphate isomerase [Alphaproteobacteria bacterium]|nr:glucose-6-phosphate isomerase [Alphaproteobacteria bacterium]